MEWLAIIAIILLVLLLVFNVVLHGIEGIIEFMFNPKKIIFAIILIVIFILFK